MPEITNLTRVEQGTVKVIGIQTGTIIYPTDPYTGEYTVTPHFAEQTLQTNGKQMLNDVTVLEIPVVRTTNPQGGLTIVIG